MYSGIIRIQINTRIILTFVRLHNVVLN